jgi:hypothetical protein
MLEHTGQVSGPVAVLERRLAALELLAEPRDPVGRWYLGRRLGLQHHGSATPLMTIRLRAAVIPLSCRGSSATGDR